MLAMPGHRAGTASRSQRSSRAHAGRSYEAALMARVVAARRRVLVGEVEETGERSCTDAKAPS